MEKLLYRKQYKVIRNWIDYLSSDYKYFLKLT